jgi:hypothetical protein
MGHSLSFPLLLYQPPAKNFFQGEDASGLMQENMSNITINYIIVRVVF